MSDLRSGRFWVSTWCAGCWLLCLPASSADWPQHLGPMQDAVSMEAGLIDTWPAEGPPVQWRHDLGLGFAGPAVRDGQVFLLDRDPGKADVLRVFSLETGDELWSFRYDAPGRVNFPGTRSTPAVSDTHVFITGEFGHLHAINRTTHQPDWAYNIYDTFPDENKTFGYGISMTLVDGLALISPTANDDPIVVAVDADTGEEAWRSEATINNQHSFHTPVIRTIAGARGIACRDARHVYFIDIQTGKTIWEHEVFDPARGPHVTIPPVTVVPGDDSRVFVTNGYRNGSVMLDVRPAPGGGGFDVTETFRIEQGGQVHPPVYVDGHLYLNINENDNLRGRHPTGGLACIDAKSGEVKWQTENDPNLNRGAVLGVDGKVIVFDADSGELLLIQPNAQRFEPIAKFLLFEPIGNSNNAWSPMALSDGRLIVRDQRAIACLDLRPASSP